jgi:hypothetical protein
MILQQTYSIIKPDIFPPLVADSCYAGDAYQIPPPQVLENNLSWSTDL